MKLTLNRRKMTRLTYKNYKFHKTHNLRKLLVITVVKSSFNRMEKINYKSMKTKTLMAINKRETNKSKKSKYSFNSISNNPPQKLQKYLEFQTPKINLKMFYNRKYDIRGLMIFKSLFLYRNDSNLKSFHMGYFKFNHFVILPFSVDFNHQLLWKIRIGDYHFYLWLLSFF